MAVYVVHLIVLVHTCSAPLGPVYWRKLGEGQPCRDQRATPIWRPAQGGHGCGFAGRPTSENRQGPSSWVLPGRDRWNVDRSALSGQWVVRNRSSWTCGRHHGSRRGEGP